MCSGRNGFGRMCGCMARVHAIPRGRNAGGTGAAAGGMAIPAKASKRELATQRAHLFPNVRISVVVPVFNTRREIPLRAGGFAACPDARRVGSLPVRRRQHVRRDAKGAGSNRRAGQSIPHRVWGGKRGHIRQHEPRDKNGGRGVYRPVRPRRCACAGCALADCGSHRRAPSRRALHR